MTRRIAPAARLVRTLTVAAVLGLPALAQAQGAEDRVAGKLAVAPLPIAQAQPTYPGDLKGRKVEGEVVASFVVTEEGRPDMSTFAVLSASHEGFAEAVKEAVARSLYAPGVANGERVAAAVEQKFVFQLRRDRPLAAATRGDQLAARFGSAAP